ncbi:MULTISPECIES: hypothetical protein [unclassified Bradyrhizobium]|uniref:hypothetical protein n=1 Tax=unclassified Bradyrhizobium TaxID=2631580 RepID=UPI001BAD1529|nr:MULTISPECIES: hypothetical protein [unclassified Bradyrhizobium]MBR1206227.1 hypothetical protein [Bradyrhizobium sp. AUGA SZCCT0124]MBR1315057.1 hypothetical protein [Bradyrhizobium sp. AUGA SZCCT0051]MBR1342028.1 hypothetical protein [Bradyrhizobium sp. AUGA SZCCT0105]MBR1358570.1 hypothetical protein [Bradyrhizobium sp. AUGA SZCCT0045]
MRFYRFPMRVWASLVARRVRRCGTMSIASFGFLSPILSAQAAGVVAGVNVINPYVLSVADQDAMLDAIHAAGVSTIRASITLDDKGFDYAERAWQRGIRIEWLIYHFGGYDSFGTTPLSAADPARFRATLQPILDRLEAKGVVLAAFELGNEINLSGTNPEFAKPAGRARQLSLLDLDKDPQGRRVARGFRQYLKMLGVLKELRDHSKLNRSTPITTAGLGTYDQDDGFLPGWAKGDIVGIHTTLSYLRAHGLDSLVDAYAVHIYPDTTHAIVNAPAVREQRIAKYDLTDCRPPGSRDGKPCWITEWGIDNKATSCPIDDDQSAQLVEEIMGDFRPYARAGSVAGLLYFAWNSTPGAGSVPASSIWRCGGLTKAGRSATDARLLH